MVAASPEASMTVVHFANLFDLKVPVTSAYRSEDGGDTVARTFFSLPAQELRSRRSC